MSLQLHVGVPAGEQHDDVLIEADPIAGGGVCEAAMKRLRQADVELSAVLLVGGFGDVPPLFVLRLNPAGPGRPSAMAGISSSVSAWDRQPGRSGKTMTYPPSGSAWATNGYWSPR